MNALVLLARATGNRARSGEENARADEEWRQAVQNAVSEHSLRTVARFAGVSHARVAQIVKEES